MKCRFEESWWYIAAIGAVINSYPVGLIMCLQPLRKRRKVQREDALEISLFLTLPIKLDESVGVPREAGVPIVQLLNHHYFQCVDLSMGTLRL